MRRRQVATWMLSALALVGCGKTTDKTELVVTVWTDFSVPNEMDAIRIRVTGKEQVDHPFQLAATQASGKFTMPIQLGLVPGGEKDELLTISAIGLYKNAEMVWQQARLPFIDGQAHELVLYLAKACQNNKCSDTPGMTCEKGACSRPITTNTEALPDYTEGQAPTKPSATVMAKPDAAVPDARAEVGQPDTLRGPEGGRPDAYLANPDTEIPTSNGDTASLVTPDALVADTNLVPDVRLDTVSSLPDTASLSDLGKPDTQRDTIPVPPDSYVCVPESDQQLCDRKQVSCAGLLGYDNCGTYRSVPSCACPTDAGTDTRLPDACAPESDQQMCSRLSRICGSLSGNDNCGQPRTVSCGTCSTDAGAPDTCVAETNAQMCARYYVSCGELWGYDNCGVYRSRFSCGVCLEDGGIEASSDAECDTYGDANGLD